MNPAGVGWSSGWGRPLKPSALLRDPAADSVLDAEATRLLSSDSEATGAEAAGVAERRADRRLLLEEVLRTYPTAGDLEPVIDRYGLGPRMTITVSVPIMAVAWAIRRSGVSSPAAAIVQLVERAVGR